jgi:nicotinate-nucleotide pyrophosphorylase (carboxylating)
MALPIPKEAIDRAVRMALTEDLGEGDLTTRAAIPTDGRARASLVTREACVVAGLPVMRRVFELLDPKANFLPGRRDGDRVEKGTVIGALEASAAAILSGERVALNFVQRLSGVATITRRFVDRVDANVLVLHTRKTTPGLRALERYAVGVGGGGMHREGLFDEVLLKENHFALSGLSVEETVRRVRESVGKGIVVGAEARNHAEARAAVAGGADYILLDNYSPAKLREEVARLRALVEAGGAGAKGRKLVIEASGGIREDNISDFAAAGVDRISVGALTHSARAIDMALDVEARA